MASFQQRLESCAASVGYKGRVRGVPKEASANRKVARFLEWLAEQLVASNSLPQQELDKFEEVKKAGVILEGAELREALDKVEGRQEKTTEELKADVSSLQQSVSALKSQLQSLNNVQKILSAHHANLLREKEDIRHTHTQSLSSYQTTLHTTQDENTRMNAALEGLQSAVDDVTSFHQIPSGKGEESGSGLLSHVPTVQYTSAEDHYLSEMTAYTKKQFFQGIAVMAHTPTGDGEEQGGVVDLNDPANVLIKGSSGEQYSSHCKELARLRALYPVVEVQCVSDVLAEQYAVAVCGRAEEMVADLRQRPPPSDATLLRQHVREKQAHLTQLHSQTTRLAQQQLPGLVQEMAALQVSTILHGDYSLKMARQDYFTSKQDKVISYLLSQTCRQELLSMLYEVELRRHRDTHRLLSATTTQLHSWRDANQTRTEAMLSSSVQPVNDVRQTIDSRDQFTSRICSMLGVSGSEPAPLPTHSTLEAAVSRLVQQVASLEALLSALESEHQQTLQEVVTMSGLLGKQVFGGSAVGKPQLSVMEYEAECSKLESLLGTMEQNIKKLLSDFDTKKKRLQGNGMIERERRLFVSFFTDPKQLNRELAELAGRVDTMTTARQTSAHISS